MKLLHRKSGRRLPVHGEQGPVDALPVYDGCMTEPTVFTRIVRGEIPATVVFDNERILAITDIAPKALVHLLVFPKTQEYTTVGELAHGDPGLLIEMVQVAQALADAHSNGQFRLVFNSGEAAGQTVPHVHAHVLGGQLTEGSLATA